MSSNEMSTKKKPCHCHYRFLVPVVLKVSQRLNIASSKSEGNVTKKTKFFQNIPALKTFPYLFDGVFGILFIFLKTVMCKVSKKFGCTSSIYYYETIMTSQIN